MHLNKIIYILSLSIIFFACKPRVEVPDAHSGEVDPVTLVSIGSTSSAGYADGALYFEAQESNYTTILGQQFSIIGGGNYNMPWVTESSVGLGITGKSRSFLSYKTDCLGVTSLSPIALASNGDQSILSPLASGSFNNYSVPNTKITDVLKSDFATVNSFYNRIAPNTNTSILEATKAKIGTFFTVNIGEYDVLEYALSGATTTLPTPISGASGIGFEASLETILLELKSTGAKGAVATVPDPTLFPFFTTIPYDGLKLDQSQVDQLNGIYGPLGISFKVGNNPFIVEDPNAGQFGVRPMQKGECILLSIPLDSVKCHKWGSLVAIPNRHVLLQNEIDIIRTSVENYNQTIKNKASQHNLALVDLYSFYKKIKAGFSYNGVTINANFVSGGAFSLDGIQLNPIGNALIANEFIKAINEMYNSTIPQVNAASYRGVVFP